MTLIDILQPQSPNITGARFINGRAGVRDKHGKLHDRAVRGWYQRFFWNWNTMLRKAKLRKAKATNYKRWAVYTIL